MAALPERAPPGGGGRDRPVARLLDIPEVADRLSLTKYGVRDLIRRDKIFSVKSGKRRLVPEYAVDDYIDQLINQAQR
jgi:excisionase family DNA binding protein